MKKNTKNTLETSFISSRKKATPQDTPGWEEVEPEIRKRNPDLLKLYEATEEAKDNLERHIEKLEEDLPWPGLE